MAARRTRPSKPLTLCVDIGGTDLKAVCLDVNGKAAGDPQRVPTAKPPVPKDVEQQIARLASGYRRFHRASVGFPGVIRRGKVLTAFNLGPEWLGRQLERTLARRLYVPVRVVNDADMQGMGTIQGRGVELVVTLGTGFGSGLFVDGKLVPNLELGRQLFLDGRSYEDHLGLAALLKRGPDAWKETLKKAIDHLRLVFNFDRLYLGGGNSRLVDFDLPKDVKKVSNKAGLWGGLALWRDEPGKRAVARRSR